KSSVPKVLHQIGGLSLLGHVLDTVSSAGAASVAVVIAPGMTDVAREAARRAPNAATFIQEPQLGTAHAVLAAREAIARHSGDILVVFGDTPFLRAESLQRLRGELNERTPLAVLGFEASNPTGYGRLLCDKSGDLVGIREEKDANAEERKITLCCSGVM